MKLSTSESDTAQPHRPLKGRDGHSYISRRGAGRSDRHCISTRAILQRNTPRRYQLNDDVENPADEI